MRTPFKARYSIVAIHLGVALGNQGCTIPTSVPADELKSTETTELVAVALTESEMTRISESYRAVSLEDLAAESGQVQVASYDDPESAFGAQSSAIVGVLSMAVVAVLVSGVTIAVFHDHAPVADLPLESLGRTLLLETRLGEAWLKVRMAHAVVNQLLQGVPSDDPHAAELVREARRAAALEVMQMSEAVAPQGSADAYHVRGEAFDAIPSEVPTCDWLIANDMTYASMLTRPRVAEAVYRAGAYVADVGYCFDEAGVLFTSANWITGPKNTQPLIDSPPLQVRLFHLQTSQAPATVTGVDIARFGPAPLFWAHPHAAPIPPGGHSTLTFLHDSGAIRIQRSPLQNASGADLFVLRQ